MKYFTYMDENADGHLWPVSLETCRQILEQYKERDSHDPTIFPEIDEVLATNDEKEMLDYIEYNFAGRSGGMYLYIVEPSEKVKFLF